MKFNLHSRWMWCVLLLFGFSMNVFAQSLQKLSPQELINNYLQEKREDLAKSGAVQYRIGDEVIEKGESIRRVYAQQTYNGIDVRDAILGIHQTKQGRQFVSDQFTPFSPNVTAPKLSASEAVRIAMTQNGGFPIVATLQEVPNAQKDAAQATIFEREEIAAANMKARLIYINASKSVNQPTYRLAWETQTFTRDRQHYWLTYVDATYGKVLDNQDLVLHCNFGGVETDFSNHEQKCTDHAHHERALAAALAIEREMEAIRNQEVSIPSADNFFSDASLMMPFSYRVLDMPADAPNDLSSGAPGNPDNTYTGVGTPNGSDPFDLFVDQTIVTTAGDPVASELGWLTTGDGSGVDTEGNNVYSFYDASPGPLGGAPSGAVPPSNATDTWDYTWDLATEPGAGLPQLPSPYGATRSAAIVNLFYWNNLIHDVFYHYGFDEPGRNFQRAANPSGPAGGVHQDNILAQAQDGGGTNNANMLTLADGVNGQMQMYLWTGSVLSNVLFSNDIPGPAIAGIPDGFPRTSPVNNPDPNTVLDMVLIDSYSGVGATSQSETDGCGYGSGAGAVADNSAVINGKVVFIDRGACSFVEKAHGAEQSGAVALVVMNNDQQNPDQAIAMGGSDATSNTLTIPAYMVSYNDGVRIKNALTANGGVIGGRLDPQGPPSTGRDGDFDNGVIAHEYGHGISTRSSIRAAGGLGTLGGDEQGGEGWSDWWGLFMTLRSNDLINPRGANSGSFTAGDLPVKGIGNYVRYLAEDGPGIRPRPYSTDMENVNEYTYQGSTNGGFGLANEEITVPHGIGFIWCTMLYEMLQQLVYQYGINDDIGGVTNSTTTNLLNSVGANADNNLALAPQLGGNVVANLLIIQGLKLQPSRGTFVDQRDAILLADDMLFNGAHKCLIWEAFAKRGLGFSAQAGSNSRGDEIEAFDLSPDCGGANAVVTIQKVAAASVHPNNNTLTYTITVTNISPIAATDVVVTDNMVSGMSFSSASNGGTQQGANVIWTLPSMAPGASQVLTVTYNINSINESCVHFFDDIENGTGNWATSGSPDIPGIATDLGWVVQSDDPFSGTKHWFVRDPDNSSDQSLTQVTNVTVTDKPTKLLFRHLVATEAGFDNGIVEISINGGLPQKVPADAFDQNAYNSTVAAADNPAQNGDSFSGSSGGYILSQIDLKTAGAAEGDNVSVQFSFSSDVLTPATGWSIDDVIYADNPTFLENTATVKPGNGVLTNQSTTVVLVEGNNCVQNEPLAVEFLDFDAAAAGQTIVLNWETANESNAEEFVIERRTKSDVLFRRIGNVEAQNEAFNRYQFVDENVRGGVEYFYRLRQVDSDAKTIFSPIRQASIAGKGEYEVTLVPNPTTGAVTLNWTKDLPNNYEVEVIAANGQIIQTLQVTNGDAPRLDLSSFPTNLYFVKINTERGSIVKKLMLNK